MVNILTSSIYNILVIYRVLKVCWYFIFNKVVHLTCNILFIFQIPRILGDALGKISARNKEYGAKPHKLIFFSANYSGLKQMNIEIDDNYIRISPLFNILVTTISYWSNCDIIDHFCNKEKGDKVANI